MGGTQKNVTCHVFGITVSFYLDLISSSFQSVDFDAVSVTVKELVKYSLKINSNNHSWLIIQADIYFGE